MDAELSPDLLMIAAYVRWRHDIEAGRTISEVLTNFNFKKFEQSCAAYIRSCEAGLGSASSHVKQESDDDEDKDADHGAGRKKQAEAKKCKGADLRFLDQKMQEPADQQCGSLLVESLKQAIVDIGGIEFDNADDQNANAIERIVTIMTEAYEGWAQAVGEGASPDLENTLRASMLFFSCILKDESLRPSVADARSARRAITSTLKDKSPAGDLAKAMMTLEAGKQALQGALTHSKAGIEDEAATAMLQSTIEALEDHLGAHATDIVAWVVGTGSEDGLNMQSFGAQLQLANGVLRATMGSLVRLSAVGLEGALPAMCAGLTNCTLVLQVAGAVMLMDLRRALGIETKTTCDFMCDSDDHDSSPRRNST